MNRLIVLMLGAIIVGCHSDVAEEELYTELLYDTTHATLDAVISIDDEIIAVGGDTWQYGLSVHITPSETIIDTIDSKRLLCIDTKGGYIVTAGISGHILSRQLDSGHVWETHRESVGRIVKGVHVQDSDKTFFAGGKSFKRGHITVRGTHGLSSLDLDLEMRSIGEVGEVLVVVGFGGVYTKSDTGSWEVNTLEGDLFNDVAGADYAGVIVGAEGKIYRSTDGLTWMEVADHGSSWEAVYYDQPGDMWVAGGQDGKVAISRDGGLTWALYQLDRSLYLTGITIHQGTHIVASSLEGMLISIALP